MIVMMICLFLLCYAIGQYEKKNKRRGLLIFFFFLTGGFHLLPEALMAGAPINKYPDFALLYFLYVLYRHIGDKRFFKVNIAGYKTLLLLLVYITIEFVITILYKWEEPSYALKTYRNYLLIGSFLLVREISASDIRKLVRFIASITVVTTLLYLLQPFTNFKFLWHAGIGDGVDGVARYRNIPYLAYFFLVYFSVKLKFTSIKRVLLLAIFVAALILTLHRGVMLGYVLTIFTYLAISQNVKKALQYGCIGLFVIALAGQFLEKRFNQDNTSEDIKHVLNLNYRSAIANVGEGDGGTFSFRVLLLVERIDYLLHTPKYCLTGVGTRHEDSPKISEFNFILGTRKPDPVTGRWIPCQISSTDLAWLTPLMRFGFIGLALFSLFTFQNMKYIFVNRKLSPLVMAAFLFYALLFFISLKNDHLFGDMQLFLIYLFIELINKTDKNNPENINENLNFDLFKGV